MAEKVGRKDGGGEGRERRRKGMVDTGWREGWIGLKMLRHRK